MPREYLSIPEAARLLHVSDRTMKRWIRQGLFHGADTSGRGIDREELLRWARDHSIAAGVKRPEPPKPAADLLADAVERGAVTSGLEATSAAEAIELAVGAVPGLDEEQRAQLLLDVLERERMASTGLGHGVALPHPRKPPTELISEPVISLVYLEEPLDWAAVDGQPVTAVLLVLSPSAAMHLQILTRIAFVLRSEEFRDFLHAQPGHEGLVERLRSIRKGP
jgi:PTS system nitrogen regulatory IIA component